MRSDSSLAEYPVIAKQQDFDRQSGSIIERLVFNHRWVIVLFCLLATVIFGVRSTQLQFNASFEKMIPTGHPYNALETIRIKYQTDSIKIHITGFAKVMGDLIEGVQVLLSFFAISIFIASALLYWHTRCVRSTLLVVFCSLVAVVWLLGLLTMLGYPLGPYSILVPFLVFAIGMSHGAQKMNGIMQDIGRGTHKLVAARYCFRRLFLAGLTALLADAVGFAVLTVIPINAIQELALTASIGVAVLIFTNLVLLPVLLSYCRVSISAAHRSMQVSALALVGHIKRQEYESPVYHLSIRNRANLCLTGTLFRYRFSARFDGFML